MNSNAKYLKINFSDTSADEIIFLCKQLLQSEKQWKVKIAAFVLEWFNESNDIAAHSSGTTGEAKNFKISKNKMKASALLSAKTFGLQKGDSSFLCLSPDYIAGKMMIVRSIVCKLNMLSCEPCANPVSTLHEKIDFAAFVPNQLFSILNSPDGSKLKSIKTIIVGGGEINDTLQELIEKSEACVYHTFGMTETVSHVAIKQISPIYDQYFTALEGIHFEKDEHQRLIIIAPSLQSEAIQTNDCVQLLNDKKFVWLGRYDNIINSGGIKINPEIIENKIRKHISRNFIIGSVKDDILNNKIALFIEGNEQIDLEKINSALEKYEQIKDVRYNTSFQYTDSGKIKRRF